MVAISVKRSMVLFGVRGMAIGTIIRGLSLNSVRPAQCIKRRVCPATNMSRAQPPGSVADDSILQPTNGIFPLAANRSVTPFADWASKWLSCFQSRKSSTGHGGACPFGSAALDHLQSPALESRSAGDCGQQAIGGLVEIVAHHLVSLPGDRQRYVSFSRLIALGRQAQIGPNIPVRTKTMPIFDRRREGKRRNRADAGHGHQSAARLPLRQSANLLVQDRDLARHVRKRVKQGADRDVEYVLLVAGHSHSLIERLGADPLRYLDPEGPQQAADLAVKLALDPNQLIPRPQ